MSSAGRAVSSNGCVTKPKEREIGLTGCLCQSEALRSLAAMSWKRPNIGSRMNREVHVRFWERLEMKLLRATRQVQPSRPRRHRVRYTPDSRRLAAAPKSSESGQNAT